jgi:hypothetical protein
VRSSSGNSIKGGDSSDLSSSRDGSSAGSGGVLLYRLQKVSGIEDIIFPRVEGEINKGHLASQQHKIKLQVAIRHTCVAIELDGSTISRRLLG